MIITPKSSFTRPADTTAYETGDLVANDVDAGDVVPLLFTSSMFGSGRGTIQRARLFKDAEGVTASFNLHLFTQSPEVTGGDNAAFAVATTRHYLGFIALDFGNGEASATDAIIAAAPAAPINFDLYDIKHSERRIYGLLEALEAYTPASGELFEATLEIYSDG